MSQEHVPEEGIDGLDLKKFSFTDWLVVFLGAALVIMVGVAVFFRYVLNSGISWSDEVARILFVWLVFIGAYIAFKNKSHATVNVLVNKLPSRLKRYHGLFVALLEGAFMATITWYGVVQVLNTDKYGQVTPGLGVPMSWFYVVIPVTALLITINIVVTAIRDFMNQRGE